MIDRALNNFHIFHIYYNETRDMMTIKFSNRSKELSIYIGGRSEERRVGKECSP